MNLTDLIIVFVSLGKLYVVCGTILNKSVCQDSLSASPSSSKGFWILT